MSSYQNSSGNNTPSTKKVKHDACTVTGVGDYQRSAEKLVDRESLKKVNKKAKGK